jgi:hypothetical protein
MQGFSEQVEDARSCAQTEMEEYINIEPTFPFEKQQPVIAWVDGNVTESSFEIALH